MPDTRHELRCFCSRKPILAFYGVDSKSRLYLHVKVRKQNQIYCEAVYYGGTASLLCRECHRWTTIRMRGEGSISPPVDRAPEVLASAP